MENTGTEEILEIDSSTIDVRNLINEFWDSPIEYEKPVFSPEISKRIKIGVVLAVGFIAAVILICSMISFISYRIEENKFNKAVDMFKSGSYADAVQKLSEFNEKSDFYLKADVYIRKYKTAQELFYTAREFCDLGDLDEALSTLSAIDIILNPYPPAEALKKEIEDIKEQQAYRSEEFSKEGLRLIESGNFENAYESFKKAVSYAENDGENLMLLKSKLAKYTAERLNEAQNLFNDGNVSQAEAILEEIAEKFPNFSRVSSVNNDIKEYYSAVEKVEKAEDLFSDSKFSEAGELIEAAVAQSPVILKTHSEILQKLMGGTINRDFMTDEQKEFLDKLEITNVLYTENMENSGMILMFDIRNTSEEPFEFRAYWCQAELDGETYYPEPATQERYVSAVKIIDGQANSDFEDDDLVISPNETYRIMYSFSGERELYTGAIFYYVDMEHQAVVENGTDGEIEGALKVPLLQIE